MTVLQLNREFGMENQLCFQEAEEGFPVAHIKNEYAAASVFLHGGQVMHFQPAGEKPLLWVSQHAKIQQDAALRGGIPVCWPRFGASSEGAALAFHGFARTSDWAVHETKTLPDGRTQLVLELGDSEETRCLWPHAFELRLTVTVGRELETVLSTRNTGETDFVFTEALHTYFNVSDIRTVSVTGLEECSFQGKTAGASEAVQKGPITFDRFVSRVYVDTEADCIIHDPGFNRRIRLSKKGSHTTVVWNPWSEIARDFEDFGDEEYLTMVCVETANAGGRVITLHPGEQHTLTSTISAES